MFKWVKKVFGPRVVYVETVIPTTEPTDPAGKARRQVRLAQKAAEQEKLKKIRLSLIAKIERRLDDPRFAGKREAYLKRLSELKVLVGEQAYDGCF